MSVAGRGCAPGSVWIDEARDDNPEASYPYSEPLPRPTPGAGGRWKVTDTVGPLIIGKARIEPVCVDPRTGSTKLPYAPLPVTITTPYTIHVAPSTTVRPGEAITVSSVVGVCSDISDPWVDLWSPSNGNPVDGVAQVAGRVGGEPWRLTLVVPAGAPPGHYFVQARCSYSRSFELTYQPVPVTVEARS